MKRLSGSGLRLAETCPASAHLAEVWLDAGDAATAGTGRHTFLENLQRMTREEALELVPLDAPWRATCEAIDPDEIPRGDPEVGVAWDPETGRVMRLDSGRRGTGYEASLPAGWIPGTIDLVVEQQQWVIDWKGPEWVDDPTINMQLGFYAVCAARLYAWDWVRVSIANIEPSGDIRWHHATLDVWDLQETEERIVALYAGVLRASKEDGPYRRGVHCQRCSSIVVCPAAMSLVAATVQSRREEPFDMTGMISTDLAQAYEDAKITIEALEHVKRAVTETVYTPGRLALPGGGELRVVERPHKKILPEVGVPILRELFEPHRVDPLLDISITNAAAEKLAKSVAPSRMGKVFVEALWERLGMSGAVHATRYQMVSLVRAKAAKKPKAAGAAQDEEPFYEGAGEEF